jgi:N-acylneuraminate cytidylyltransferase
MSARQSEAFALVLARAGSKGVPGKNTMAIAGRPCVAWTIEHALRSRLVSRVLVSSDDPSVLAIASRMGATALPRPPHLASDTARVDDAARQAMLEVLGVSEREIRDDDDRAVVLLYGNVPVRPEGCIDRAITTLRERKADSVQSYQPVGKYHPWWTARVQPDGSVLPWQGEVLNHGVFRRQDLPAAHVPDGAVLVVTLAALFLRRLSASEAPGPHSFFGMVRAGIVHEEGSVIDIDQRTDALVADAMLRERVTHEAKPWGSASMA